MSASASSASEAPTAPRAGGYLFLPSPLRRTRALLWLRRTHAWLGVWGGVLGLLFGVTGILQNHRSIMKIPGPAQTQSNARLQLERIPESADALADRLRIELRFERPAYRIRSEKSRPVAWGDRTLVQPERWEIAFSTPRRHVQVEYWVGDRHVALRQSSSNFIRAMIAFHKAEGVHPAWVILADTLAGSLIVLCVSGCLLWSRLHGGRLVALGIGASALLGVAWIANLSV